MKKKELIELLEEILDLIEGRSDPYATHEEVIIQIQSKVAGALGKKPWQEK
jgi:hypothetical protein